MMWRYCGKADPAFEGRHHAAVLHSLDVAAFAAVLVLRDPLLRRKVGTALGSADGVVETTAFFCALHVIGKFDVRFQVKAPDVAERLQPGLTGNVARAPYDHGVEGFRQLDEDDDLIDLFGPGGNALLQGVCGHHGSLPERSSLAESLEGEEKHTAGFGIRKGVVWSQQRHAEDATGLGQRRCREWKCHSRSDPDRRLRSDPPG